MVNPQDYGYWCEELNAVHYEELRGETVKGFPITFKRAYMVTGEICVFAILPGVVGYDKLTNGRTKAEAKARMRRELK